MLISKTSKDIGFTKSKEFFSRLFKKREGSSVKSDGEMVINMSEETSKELCNSFDILFDNYPED